MLTSWMALATSDSALDLWSAPVPKGAKESAREEVSCLPFPIRARPRVERRSSYHAIFRPFGWSLYLEGLSITQDGTLARSASFLLHTGEIPEDSRMLPALLGESEYEMAFSASTNSSLRYAQGDLLDLLERGGWAIEDDLLYSARDERGRSLLEAMTPTISRMKRLLQTKDLKREQLNRLPISTREAILAAIASDTSGRIREKLLLKSEVLIALAFFIGVKPEAWVRDGQLTEGPMDIVHGEKERTIFERAAARYEGRERDAWCLNSAHIKGPASALIYARLVRERTLTFTQASLLWEANVEPDWIPRHNGRRRDWLGVFHHLHHSDRSLKMKRYAAQYFRPSNKKSATDFIRELDAVEDELLRRPWSVEKPLPHPTILVRRSRERPLRGLASLPGTITIKNYTFRRARTIEEIRALGRKYNNCLRDTILWNDDLWPSLYVLFEALWKDGSCLVHISYREDSEDSMHIVEVSAYDNKHIDCAIEDEIREALDELYRSYCAEMGAEAERRPIREGECCAV